MTKTVIREIIIALLICLALLLILSVLFYNYIPANKVIPEAVQYAPSKDVQTQLNSSVNDNSNEILKTYEITAQELENYQKTNEYKPGKANPFADISDTPETNEGDSQSVTTNPGNSGNTNNSGTTSNGSSNNSNSSGTLFEGSSSK